MHRELIGLRRRHPWLVRARTVVEHLTNTQLLLRVTDENFELLVALNLGEPETSRPPVAALAGRVRTRSARRRAASSWPQHGWCVLAPDDTDSAESRGKRRV